MISTLKIKSDLCSKKDSQKKQSENLGPVVQSIVSLTSSIVVKMLTVQVSNNIKFKRVFAEKM